MYFGSTTSERFQSICSYPKFLNRGEKDSLVAQHEVGNARDVAQVPHLHPTNRTLERELAKCASSLFDIPTFRSSFEQSSSQAYLSQKWRITLHPIMEILQPKP
ncbi:Uncharacterized protein HZ326_27995 [Fusarium oxysporum f. sp. albedinis]|nr:Uncharacterized protein HZ326_27995 [Fusarium oxysporum f. sp. albedinis]